MQLPVNSIKSDAFLNFIKNCFLKRAASITLVDGLLDDHFPPGGSIFVADNLSLLIKDSDKFSRTNLIRSSQFF